MTIHGTCSYCEPLLFIVLPYGPANKSREYLWEKESGMSSVQGGKGGWRFQAVLVKVLLFLLF